MLSKSLHLDGEKKKKSSKMLLSASFSSGMQEMSRHVIPEREKYPKHQVHNETIGKSGMTYSMEQKGDTVEGMAELEVHFAFEN
jgi:hypothetical protein